MTLRQVKAGCVVNSQGDQVSLSVCMLVVVHSPEARAQLTTTSTSSLSVALAETVVRLGLHVISGLFMRFK